MSSRPEVTIGIPVYNGEALLRTALDSVLRQDFADLEILIGDNASTDGTPHIVAEYVRLDPRVRCVRHDANVGGWNNFFYLLDNARGRFFSWLAYDDSYETSDHIRKLVETLRDGCSLAFPNVTEVHYTADGRIERRVPGLFEPFRTAHTRFAMSRVAVRFNAHQIYGMFRIETLRSYVAALKEDQQMTHFGENRFVQKVIAHERCAFVPGIIQNFGLEDRKKDRPTNVPRRMIRDYLRYSRRLLAMYWRSPLTVPERLRIHARIVRMHLPNLIMMTGMVVKRNLMHAIRSYRMRRND